MKFVKENLVPVICGAVIVVLLLAVFVYPLPGMKTELNEKFIEKSNIKGTAEHLTNQTVQVNGNEPYKGPITANAVEIQQKTTDEMSKQSDEINEIASQKNSEGRVIQMGGDKDHPHFVPLLNPAIAKYNQSARNGAIIDSGVDNLLPKQTKGARPDKFDRAYKNRPLEWIHELNLPGVQYNPTRQQVPGYGRAPTAEDVTLAWQKEQQSHPGPHIGGMTGGSDASQADPGFTKRFVTDRANALQIYVDWPGAFHMVDTNTRSLDESKIFEAFIDTWYQNDVVAAIVKTNSGGPPGASRSVATNPVKRLLKITIGSGLTAPGSDTGADTGAAAPAPGSAGANGLTFAAGGIPTMFSSLTGSAPTDPNNPGAPLALDPSRSMTGRIGSTSYDVVEMRIVLDIDPAYLNTFIDNLYRTNNGYTVLNMRWQTVDPLDAASNGYLYGNSQVIRVNMRVEGLLFRKWTTPLMPDAVKTLLHVS